ncbi:MAG: hypothetical protein VKP72_11750 [bacterium]|nr:hypothetical protein [bacterium]
MMSGWRWFRGPGNRVIAVHWPAEMPTGGAWQLRPLGQALPERFLAVPFHGHAGDEPSGEDAGSLPWYLTRDRDRHILVSPQHAGFHELVPATRKRLVSSRVMQGSLSLSLLLGGLAWLTPSAIRAWRDRPVPLYEQVVDGAIVLSPDEPNSYRATWIRKGETWARVPPAPAPSPRTSTRPEKAPGTSARHVPRPSTGPAPSSKMPEVDKDGRRP